MKSRAYMWKRLRRTSNDRVSRPSIQNIFVVLYLHKQAPGKHKSGSCRKICSFLRYFFATRGSIITSDVSPPENSSQQDAVGISFTDKM